MHIFKAEPTHPDGLELVGKVLAARRGGVEVRLHDEAETPAIERYKQHVSFCCEYECALKCSITFSSRLRTTRSRCLRFMLVVMRDTPSYGTRCISLTSKRISCKRKKPWAIE